MTARLDPWLLCDECAREQYPEDAGSLTDVGVRACREEARLNGWRFTRDGRDLCPKCASQQRPIVIHRDRTFEYNGEAFRVYGSRGSDSANPGWGYEVVHVATGRRVAIYDTRSDIRAHFPADYEAEWEDSG